MTAAAAGRPLVHFTPPAGWMNDPNGLVFADGVYHLCYQHHPGDLLWGPMHWGHATSEDLVAWEHRPIALAPDHLGTAFSGSAVVDRDGVAGHGAGALVAFYTQFVEDVPQCQSVAFSRDGGTSWRPHAGNPVLRAPEGIVDFRDPKVLRLPGAADRPWVMVLVAGEAVLFYRSADLLDWAPAGRFGAGHGAHGGVWETPDLFELADEETGRRRWVLTVSVQEGGPAGGSGTQYFVGDFDGAAFVCDDAPEVVRWVDLGADFYAPQSWSDTPDGRRVWLAWMSNWAYARETPASVWRGAMTVPRDLRLRRRDGRLVLAQQPVPELDRCVVGSLGREGLRVQPGEGHVLATGVRAADLRVRWRTSEATSYGVELRRHSGPPTTITYDPAAGLLVVAPSDEGLPPGARAARREVPLVAAEDTLELRVLVDTGSVEVFADDGCVTVTDQVFGGEHTEVRLVADGGVADVASVRLRELGGPRSADGPQA